MKGLFCWIVVALSLFMVISSIPAEAAHAGSSSSGGFGSSGSTSMESPGVTQSNGDTAPFISNSGSFSVDIQQEDHGISAGMANSGNTPGSGIQDGYASSAPGTPAGSAGPDDKPDPSDGRSEAGPDGGSPDDSPIGGTGKSARDFEGSEPGSFADGGAGSPARTGVTGKDHTEQGPEPAQVKGMQGIPGQSESGQGYPATPQEEGGSSPVRNNGEGRTGIMAASIGIAGIARSGFGNGGGYESAGENPQGPPPARQQQGPPSQSGHYPCGPAQTSPVPPVQGPAENESKSETSPRPRSKRTRFLFIGMEQDVPDAPSHPRVPLFPFNMLLFGGYRRISKKNVLEHDARHIIYTTITRHPGIDVKNLAGLTGINENTLRYHLVKLVETGKVTYLVRPGIIRFFLNQGAYSTCEQVLIHYLRTETPHEILRLLYLSPGMTRQQISDALAISGPSVTRQMDHLIDDRVVENRFPGRSNHYYLTAEAANSFTRIRPGILNEGGDWKMFSSSHEARSPVSSAAYPSEMPRIPGI